jgi:hypothetical protein
VTAGAEQTQAALATLAALERQVRAQELALLAVPEGATVPAPVLALLAAPPPPLDPDALPMAARPRLAAVVDTLVALQDTLQARQHRIRDRLLAIHQRQQPPRPAVLVDWRS